MVNKNGKLLSFTDECYMCQLHINVLYTYLGVPYPK